MHGVLQIATARCVGAFNSDSYFFASAQPDCDQQSDGWMHAIRCGIQVALFAPYRYDVGLRHPKLEWCYQGEDYMQQVKKLASSCLRGNTPQLAIN